jgi:hypothetical protein
VKVFVGVNVLDGIRVKVGVLDGRGKQVPVAPRLTLSSVDVA